MEEVTYTRLYWLAFLVAGLFFTLSSYLDYLAAGRATLWIGLSLVLGVFVVSVSAFAVRFPERTGGPTEFDFRFALAVGIALLMAGLTLGQLLGP